MKTKKTIWIPAILAVVAALLLMAYYYYLSPSHSSGKPIGGAGVMRPPREEGPEGGGKIFKTLGTISVFLGACSFSWFWFKRKLKSPSMLIRRTGKLLRSVHKLLGWATLTVIAVHGIYFLFTKPEDNKIYTGLAGFVILLVIAGYGFFINKVRNKWMRTVHRSLGLLWVPVLLLHAGGSVILAVIASLAVWALVRVLERKGKEPLKPSSQHS
ncbi:hypothetical protein SAMN04487895_111108 [Paenibacillus sophorae]|uniref:Ferric reductase like transmembrane component n=1 Tax=Paenibacillus sophorae TaxID=1333845 RepID=A0A1H8SB21_9BACL|nr:hypothetical protein [Paenibacillus sophorae]QWU16777.1 hypothetical protein KP014_06075 [Paenibacillus sophorae]SEO76279.1 hypothetical protein SAMN04487895_111108 [Paenibacillus sophorae]